METATQHEINWFVTAGTLRSSFIKKTRLPTADPNLASTYWASKDEINIGSDVNVFIRKLHDDELPNDWRYDTIVGILDQIIENSKYNDSPIWDSWEIADSLTSVSTSELASWFADNPGRCSYHDEAEDLGLIDDQASLGDRMQKAQRLCIQSMAERVLSEFKLTD